MSIIRLVTTESAACTRLADAKMRTAELRTTHPGGCAADAPPFDSPCRTAQPCAFILQVLSVQFHYFASRTIQSCHELHACFLHLRERSPNMSGIGLSPTDIVSGARVVGRGAAALRENGGSKDKYQQTAAGLDARIAAFSRLKEFAASAGPSASSSAVSVHASNLRRNDLALQNSQKKYDRRLGTNALGKRWRSIRWALGWEFRGHEEAKEYNHRSEAAKDALLLDTLLCVPIRVHRAFN